MKWSACMTYTTASPPVQRSPPSLWTAFVAYITSIWSRTPIDATVATAGSLRPSVSDSGPPAESASAPPTDAASGPSPPSARLIASTDQREPSGRKTAQRSSIERRASPAFNTIGFLAWRESNNSYETTVASRVRYPTASARATAPATANSAATAHGSPESG